MNKIKFLFPILLTAFILTGCIDTDDTFTINPNGSGKVLHKALIKLDGMSLNFGQEELSDEEKLHNAVKDELQKASGVDTWGQVTFEQEGNAIRLEGTAYFKDLNKLKFHNGGTTISMYNKIKFSEDSGYMTIEIVSSKSKVDDKSEEPQGPLTDEEIMAEIEKQRGEYQKSRLMIAGLMGSMHIKRTFYLPGNSGEVLNLKEESDGSYLFDFQGSQMIAIMDAKFADDELMRESVMKGRSMMKDGPGGPDKDDSLNEMIFGTNGPVYVEVEHWDQTLFDYEQEVALARTQFAQVQDKLGIIPEALAEESTPGTFKVGGVRIVKYSDQDNMVRAFNYDEGYVLSIYGHLPEKALKVTEGRLTELIADTGEDFLPEKDWDQKISFPNLSNDGMVTIFEIKLNNIPEDARSIKTLSGTVDYLTGGATREIDLGFSEIAAGANGTQFNATIKELKADDYDKARYALVLSIAKPPAEIKNFIFYDSGGPSF